MSETKTIVELKIEGDPDKVKGAEVAQKIEQALPKQEPEKKAEIALTNGLAIGNTVEERFRVCSAYVKSGMLPKGYDTPEKAFIGIQYALEIGFHNQPLTALRNICVINGQPTLWGELPLALVRKSGQLENIKEYFISKDKVILDPTCDPSEVWAAICIIKRRGYEEKTFAYTRAETSGLGVKAIWDKFFKIMIKRKARALAIKDEFGDCLLGMTIAEYDYHTMPDGNSVIDVELNPNQAKVNELNEKFKER